MSLFLLFRPSYLMVKIRVFSEHPLIQTSPRTELLLSWADLSDPGDLLIG